MFKLSVAIPTFNRSDYLSITLDKLIEEIDGNYDKVEIVISDNCSTDDTESIIKSKKYPNLTYHKQSQNLGFMKNFEMLSELSSGEYTWYLGDDDIPTDGAISKIIDVIEQDTYSMLYLNCQPYVFRNTGKKIYRNEKNDIYFSDGRDLFNFANTGIQFISAIVVNTDYMLQATKKCADLFEEQTHIIEFMSVLLKDKAVFISDVMVLAGYTDESLSRNKYTKSTYKIKTNWYEVFFYYPQLSVDYALKNLMYENKHVKKFMLKNDYQFLRTYSYKKKEKQTEEYKFISFSQGLDSVYTISAKMKFLIVYFMPSVMIKASWKLAKLLFEK